MIAYLSILLTACLAFVGMPIYCILLGAVVLFALSFIEQRKLSPRFGAIGASYVLTMAAWQSAGEALIASGTAYTLGITARAVMIN
ncbi:hypothetical protein [Hyphomicrobium sp.]|uniref:hypothetical protein n=1 Tax=Hyphomicrobium sp. TaxID=82 RepID=UPI0025BF4F07|nr:hypothetical protein [Hyphomicrobium sp.]MCC7253355.1 hypothetical protein [Hyphomicrobium sp.]